ncbi:MAG TPA: long-chain fatty acid--CoA ligase [Candidatus Dormibacteraeota bacterium]
MANDQGIGYWLTRRAALSPAKTALIFEGAQWTYAALNQRVNTLAHALKSLGVNHGDRVGYLDLNHPNFFLTLFATAKLGAIFVPLNFRLAGPELLFIINDAGVHTLIHDEQFAPVVDSIRDELTCRHLVRTNTDAAAQARPPAGIRGFDQLFADQRDSEMDNQVSPDEVAWIMYTSGTTGRPKGAMLTHGNVLWNNISAWVSYDSSTNDVTLVCAPLFHIGGLNVTPMTAFTKGATVVLLRQYDPVKVLESIAAHRVTTMFGVPAMFQFMALVPGFAEADLGSVTAFICGGAPVPETLIRLYADRGIPFVQGYGLTETAPFATIVPMECAASKVGSAGLPPFFTDVKLFDDDDEEVAIGERGEVCVRGPNVMKGYWNRPDATAEVIRNGWFHTGDIGRRDADGFFYIVDRKKDMIISGGENVYPAEVEDCLYAHPDVAEVAVIGVPDAKWGETVRAIVVAKPGTAPTAEQIVEFCQGRLARYKQPQTVVFTDVLPRNPAGKVLKFELRERFGGAEAGPSSPAAVAATEAPAPAPAG